jgi:curved DNA-binding protein CbpA
MREGLACRCGRGTLYDVLQVSPWCEPEVIQAAFRALARTRHPDVNRDPDAEEQMRRLNVAYQTLSDPGRRARYDEELALEAARPVVTARPAPAPAPGPSVTPGWATPAAAPNGHRARHAGPGPRPTSTAASSAAASVSAASTPAYQTTIFDTRGEMLFPRSAIYASLIIVTVIVALVAWLILDTLAQRPNAPTRFPRGYEEMRSGPTVASSWQSERLGASVEPGLSLSDDRWKQ